MDDMSGRGVYSWADCKCQSVPVESAGPDSVCMHSALQETGMWANSRMVPQMAEESLPRLTVSATQVPLSDWL